MSSFYDDDKSRASSDNDEDEEMEDLAGGDAEGNQDLEAEIQNEDDNQDGLDDDDDQDDQDDSPTRPSARRQLSSNGIRNEKRRESLLRHGSFADETPKSPRVPISPFWPTLRPEMVTASEYDIVPTIAAPQSTSINTITATPDMRWVFSGGSDGWIRKFHWVDTINGKSQLTVAQRHPFVDSVQKAGLLQSYWENEESRPRSNGAQYRDAGSTMSPVYSLAVQHQALWLLSGTEYGGINLQTVRHDEGKRITTLTKHTSAVSVMSLSRDEASLLSGSWDKNIHDWDLNTGQVKRSFLGSGGQISAIEIRPISDMPVPRDFAEPLPPSDTFGTASLDRRKSRGSIATGVSEGLSRRESAVNGDGSPTDSLFGTGDADSLFGDNDNAAEGTMGFGADEDDKDYSKAFTDSLEQQERQEQAAAENDKKPTEQNGFDEATLIASPITLGETAPATNGDMPGSRPRTPAADRKELDPSTNVGTETDQPLTSETIFLDAAIDGTLRIWDRRQPNPIARMVPSRGTRPWCMHACWSQDGNAIYAGRWNGTVDEYSFHKGLREPHRTLTFPTGSGAVSAVRAMPNGKHLICASFDILRLYDLKAQENAKKSIVPFQIVPGHRTGVVSQLFIDSSCTYMISTGGNRGWEGSSTEVLLGYEINLPGKSK